MQRTYTTSLYNWKKEKKRKPLVLLGARQVGKSYLVHQFGKEAYGGYHVFDFEQDPSLASLFDADLDPHRILEELNIRQRSKGHGPIKDDHLIFFDEVQESPRALASLRYFYEQKPEINIIAAGSLLGVKLSGSFPVGRIQELTVFPMCFEEFLLASGDALAIEMFQSKSRLQEAHKVLWRYYIDYLFVGGMPEIVSTWTDIDQKSEGIEPVPSLQTSILSQYYKDFVKHSGKTNANHVSRVFDDVPRQLANNMDSSTKRFKFKGVLPGQSKYIQLAGPIDWLREAGLVYSCQLIEGSFSIPLAACTKNNIFKLFFFDVGLLGNKLGLSYESHSLQNYGITKGYIAENFVACELTAKGLPLFSWQGGKSEIEFLACNDVDGVFPIEVKSGARTQAKSLKVFTEKFLPKRTVKLVGKVGGTHRANEVLPIYYASHLKSMK